MTDFRFRRLEKYKIGGTPDKMQLSVPLPRTPSGKTYRWCPNEMCTPRLFLLGNERQLQTPDTSKVRRPPNTPGITCPYCGIDANDSEFVYEADVKSIHDQIKWSASRDMCDHIEKMAKNFNRSQPRGGLFSVKMEFRPSRIPEPRALREDLIRNLACNICGREYGTYAIALFCPDCGAKNLGVHFEREVELILQQIDLAEQVASDGNGELSYRILGNAHEDVVTALETYQKVVYKYLVKKTLPREDAGRTITKKAIGNSFQNIEKARRLYKILSIDPFGVLSSEELELICFNIQKRHVIGHNLSMADDAYAITDSREKPDTTVGIIADEVSEFAKTGKKVILELELLL